MHEIKTDPSSGFLLLLPVAAVLIPGAGVRFRNPALRKRVLDVALPLGVTVGLGDFGVERVAIAILIRHERLHLRPLRQRNRVLIANVHMPIARQPDGARREVGLQLPIAIRERADDRAHFRRADVEVRALGLRRRDQRIERRADGRHQDGMRRRDR